MIEVFEMTGMMDMKKTILIFFVMLFALSLTFAAEGVATSETTTLSIIKIENESYYSPYPAEPGQYIDVWIRVRQSGAVTQAENVVCKIIPKFPFSLDEGESAEKSIGTLGTGQLVLLKYRLKVSQDATEGNNEVEFACNFNNAATWPSMLLKIYVQAHDAVLSISDVKAEPNAFLPGEDGVVTVKISNLANLRLKDITVSMDMSNSSLPFSPFNDVNEKRITQIEKGGEVELQFKLQASPTASVDVYKIPITLAYYDTLGKSYSKKQYISLAIDAKPQLFFALESTTLTKKGTKGRVSVSIANEGLSNIKFVTVKTLQDPDYIVLSGDEKYVGNLDPDDSSSADFDIYTNTSKKQLPVKFEVGYVDQFGRSHTESKEVSVKIYENGEAIAMGLEKPKETDGWLIGLGAVVVLFVIWRVYKFFKKNGARS